MIRVGTAGWSYPDWEGVVYPRPKPRDFHGLPYLAQFFGCVEINSSFYAMPSARHCESWLKHVHDRPNFRFLAKLNQVFTHGAPQLAADHERALGEFRAGIEPLLKSGKFGALLIQFPAHFQANKPNAVHLAQLVRDWPDVPLALELRHRSWFMPERLDWIRQMGATLLHVDMPSAGDHPPGEFPATSRLGYLRLHGRNQETWFKRGVGRDDRYNYLYTPQEVDDLAAKVERMTLEYDDVYVVTNNHFAGQAVVNGIELEAQLGTQPLFAPAQLIERYPRLRKVAEPLGQRNLF